MNHPLELENRLEQAWPPARWQEVSVLVAVSGGADSVGLLRALTRLKTAGAGRLLVAHFNHALRGAEADADQQFVADLAAGLGLSCHVGRAAAGELDRLAGDGLEAAARSVRYQFLKAAAAELGARYVVTAHTADDQLETTVQRIFRGTGIGGLAGIPRTRPLGPAATLVRPLLDIGRADIRQYLGQLGQTWREDPTNASATHAARNWIRHVLIPGVTENISPGAPAAILRLAHLAAEAQQIIASAAAHLAERAIGPTKAEGFSCDCDQLAGQPGYLVREMLIRLWRERGWPEQAMGFAEWDSLAQMALRGSTESPVVRDFPGGVRAQKKGARLSLARP